MGFLNDLFKRKNATVDRVRELIAGSRSVSSGESVTIESAAKNATVYACAKIISEDVAKLPLNLFKKVEGNDREKVSDEPLYDILHNKPNDQHTPIEFWEMLVWDLVIRGNAFAFISRATTSDRKILEIIPIPVNSVKVEFKNNQVNYSLFDGSSYKPVPKDQIFHIRDLPNHTGMGRTRIDFAAEAFGLDIAGEKLTGELFANKLRMTPVLSHPRTISDGARQRLKADVLDKAMGSNGFEPMVLEEGLVWSPSMMTLKDAQLLELRSFSRSIILSLYRMPPHKVGEMDRATYSNVELKEREYVTGCLLSYIVRIEQAIYRDLFTDKQRAAKYYAKFNYNSLVRADMLTRFNSYQVGIRAGIYNPDEVRAFEDLNPRSDGRGGIYLESGDLYPSGEPRNAI